MTKRPVHAPLRQFPIIDDELHIGGMPIHRLAEQVGQTPFYAYDREAITRRVHDLREALPGEINLYYAIKANPMPAVVDHVASLVDGLDVASAGELAIALDSGMDPTEISFAGPGKRDQELHNAVAAGITIHVESESELERIARQAELVGDRANIALRVNPDFEFKSSGMKMGGGSTPFGIDAERIPAAIARARELDLHFRGFHIYSGSQSLRGDRLVETQEKTFQLAYRLVEAAAGPIEVLNIGGGLGIPYFPGEMPLDLAQIGDALADRVTECRQRLGDTEIILELGRFLVGEAGVYVCRVVDKKVSRGRTYLICDGGMHHHLAASGNFGQVLRRNFPVVTACRVHGEPRETVSVVGPLCTPLDVLADRMAMGSAEIGELIAVLQSGAYGLSASPTGFLSHPLPKEVLV